MDDQAHHLEVAGHSPVLRLACVLPDDYSFHSLPMPHPNREGIPLGLYFQSCVPEPYAALTTLSLLPLSDWVVFVALFAECVAQALILVKDSSVAALVVAVFALTFLASPPLHHDYYLYPAHQVFGAILQLPPPP